MTRVALEDGRIGDIWRVEGKDHEMVITGLTRHSITLNSVADPQPSGWGYDLNDWDNVLYRIREDLANVQTGDRVHICVPQTEVYLLKVTIDTRWPSLSGWLGYQKGRLPDLQEVDAGLFFHPSADERLVVSRVFRAYEMLEPGETITDSDGQAWTFEPPLRFIGDHDEVGIPTWPLTVPNDPSRTERINRTTYDEQIHQWTLHAGVEPSVYDFDWDHGDD